MCREGLTSGTGVRSLAVGIRRNSTIAVVAALGVIAGCSSAETPSSDRPPSISHISANYGADTPTGASGKTTPRPELGETSTPTRSPTKEPSPTPTHTKTTEPDKKPSRSPTQSASPPDPTSQPDPIAVLEDEAVELTNKERERRGCGPLKTNDRLRTAARGHSEDMAARDYFNHTSPDGDGPGERAEAAGYDAWGGENIAMGYASAEDVVAGWMNSEGHRENILNCDFQAIGVGLADSARGEYWTQMFGYE